MEPEIICHISEFGNGYVPLINIEINETRLQTLLDSGANTSVISPESAFKLQNVNRVPANHLIRVANGGIMRATEAIITNISIGQGRKMAKLIIAPIPYEVILGTNNMAEITISRTNGTATIDGCKTELLEQGRQTICTVMEEVILQPSSINYVYARNAVDANTAVEEPAVLIENMQSGFCAENDITITEGVYTNAEYIKIGVYNPWPFKMTIPTFAPLAYANAMEDINGKLQCNELMEVSNNNEHQTSIKCFRNIKNYAKESSNHTCRRHIKR